MKADSGQIRGGVSMPKKITKEDYSKIKAIAWRFGRVFLATFLVELGVAFPNVKTWGDVYPLLLVPAVSAGLVALSKAVREYFAGGDYKSLLQKLPL